MSGAETERECVGTRKRYKEAGAEGPDRPRGPRRTMSYSATLISRVQGRLRTTKGDVATEKQATTLIRHAVDNLARRSDLTT